MISRWDPFRDLSVLQDKINRIFNETTRPAEGSTRTWAPVVDIIETEGDLIVRAEIPGMKREDIDIEITSESLTIKGERKFDEQNKEGYLRVERPYGPFQRSFSIGVPVDAEKVKAAYQDGILEVVIPKSEAVKPKKIPVASD
jgi:HSP20 family protein